MEPLTAESLRRLAELGTRSTLYGPGVTSVSRSEYERSIAPSVDLNPTEDWDVSSHASTEAIVFDLKGPNPAPAPASDPAKEVQMKKSSPPPVAPRRAMTDVGDDSENEEAKQHRVKTRTRRRASMCVAPSPSLLRKAGVVGYEPKSELLRGRLHKARAELRLAQDVDKATSVSGDSETSASSPSQGRSAHYKPEKPIYLRENSATSSSRPPSPYMAYKPKEKDDESLESPDLVELTSSGSLYGDSVPATPIDPEAMFPDELPSPSFSTAAESTAASYKDSIISRGRHISKVFGGSRSASRDSRYSEPVSFRLSTTTTAVSTYISTSIPMPTPTVARRPASTPPASPSTPKIARGRSRSPGDSSTRSSHRSTGSHHDIKAPTPRRTPSPNPSQDRSHSRSRSRSPAAGTYVEDPLSRRSFIDRTIDRAEARLSFEVNKHLVRAGRRPLPSFEVRSIDRSPIQDVSDRHIWGPDLPTTSEQQAGEGVCTGSQNRPRLRRQHQHIEPYRGAATSAEVVGSGSDVYRSPTKKASDELFGIRPKTGSVAGLQSAPRRRSNPKLVIDTKITESPAMLPATLRTASCVEDFVAPPPPPPPKQPRTLRRRNDSLFLGSDVSMSMERESFFPVAPQSVPQTPSQAPAPQRRQQRQQQQQQFQTHGPPAAPAEPTWSPPDYSGSGYDFGDDSSILPDQPLDLGSRPTSSEQAPATDHRDVLPSQSTGSTPPPAFMPQRRTLTRKAGNRSLR